MKQNRSELEEACLELVARGIRVKDLRDYSIYATYKGLEVLKMTEFDKFNEVYEVVRKDFYEAMERDSKERKLNSELEKACIFFINNRIELNNSKEYEYYYDRFKVFKEVEFSTFKEKFSKLKSKIELGEINECLTTW